MKGWRMGPSSGHVSRRRRRRPRLGLACQRIAAPASPRGPRPCSWRFPSLVTACPLLPYPRLPGWRRQLTNPLARNRRATSKRRHPDDPLPACPAVRVRYSGVLSHGGDSDLPGRAIRVALRGLQQAALGDGTPRAAQVGLQGVPEQTSPAPWRRCPAGAEPLPDATAPHGSGTDGSGGHHRRPGTALLPISRPARPAEGRGLVHRRPASARRSDRTLDHLPARGHSGPWRKHGGPNLP